MAVYFFKGGSGGAEDPSAFDQERFWSQLCNRCRFAFAVVGLPATHFGYHQVVEDHDPSARMRVQLAEPMLHFRVARITLQSPCCRPTME
jgi:hypothetical protein